MRAGIAGRSSEPENLGSASRRKNRLPRGRIVPAIDARSPTARRPRPVCNTLPAANRRGRRSVPHEAASRRRSGRASRLALPLAAGPHSRRDVRERSNQRVVGGNEEATAAGLSLPPGPAEQAAVVTPRFVPLDSDDMPAHRAPRLLVQHDVGAAIGEVRGERNDAGRTEYWNDIIGKNAAAGGLRPDGGRGGGGAALLPAKSASGGTRPVLAEGPDRPSVFFLTSARTAFAGRATRRRSRRRRARRGFRRSGPTRRRIAADRARSRFASSAIR